MKTAVTNKKYTIRGHKSLLLLVLATWCCIGGFAQASRDSVCTYYLRGYSTLDLKLRDNQNVLQEVISELQALQKDTTCYDIRLHIIGNASPEGTDAANKRLAKKRAEGVLRYLRQQVSLPDSMVSLSATGVDWDGLILLLEKNPQVPKQQEALRIVRETPIWIFDKQGRIVDGRKRQLMNLAAGNSFRYMDKHLFPELRNTTIELRYKQHTPPEPEPEPAPEPPVTAEPEPVPVPEPAPEPEPQPVEYEYVYTPWSLKTNLVYDALLMPSLEIAYRINDRWSAAVEGSVAWWKNDGAHKYYQIATIIPEGRYWFHTKAPWHGHYVGLFVGGSWYDLENGKRGYKGEFVTTGISYGYMFPIGRALSLEAGIGVGFLHTTYEEYLPIDGHYVYQQTSRTNWFGPVKLKFALVWRLGKKQGGTVR